MLVRSRHVGLEVGALPDDGHCRVVDRLDGVDVRSPGAFGQRNLPVLEDPLAEEEVVDRDRTPILPAHARLQAPGELHLAVRAHGPVAVLDRRDPLRDARGH